ncbi:MAG TPA: tetratricopeptide repeat protein [Thermoanaerobaculia bacterium]|nr:tetratricopeptide repeat protein [Thermoanaerobaculia bacterium]
MADAESALAAGIEAYDAGRFEEAADAFRAALAAGVDPVQAWTNLGAALTASGRAAAAVACYGRALTHDPERAESLGNRGNAYHRLGDSIRAVEDLTRAAELDPTEARWRRGLGVALLRAGRLAAALGAFDEGLALAPGDPQLEFLRGCALLQLGRWAEGWPGYDRRFETGELADRGFGAPQWDGAALEGRVLLLHAEQGHGDLIQFARFLPAALERAGGRVIVEVHPNLRRLFAASFPDAEVIGVGDPVPRHDLRLPWLSLARLVAHGPETGLRADGGYLPAPAPDPARKAGRPRVGIAWKGNPRPWDRSCPLARILGLLEAADVELVSVQRDGAAEIERVGAQALIEDATPGRRDFLDDAELVTGLDLVITVDTAVAHLAGALGRPVWTLLTHATDWRYPPEGETTPWYPTMRLFRQPRPGDWEGAIAAAGAALAEWAAEGARRFPPGDPPGAEPPGPLRSP